MIGSGKRFALTPTEFKYWLCENRCDSCCDSSLRKTYDIEPLMKTTDGKKGNLLKSLASEYQSDNDSVLPREPGTGEWLIEDERFLK